MQLEISHCHQYLCLTTPIRLFYRSLICHHFLQQRRIRIERIHKVPSKPKANGEKKPPTCGIRTSTHQRLLRFPGNYPSATRPLTTPIPRVYPLRHHQRSLRIFLDLNSNFDPLVPNNSLILLHYFYTYSITDRDFEVVVTPSSRLKSPQWRRRHNSLKN